MKLRGLDGSNLFGFLAAYGLLRLVSQHFRQRGELPPQMRFDETDYCAVLDGVSTLAALESAVRAGLEALEDRLSKDFVGINRPSDLSEAAISHIASLSDGDVLDDLAGFGCNIDGNPYESTLCAANGAGHQNLLVSMRDVLALLKRQPEALVASIDKPWRYKFELTASLSEELGLGDRKPTLRLDPADERLYALRLGNPVSKGVPYRTELGAQALAAAAFGGLTVVPRQRHTRTISSERKGSKAYFCWGLWNVPASYLSARSLLARGVRNDPETRARGVFASFRAARVTGAKGKLSFAPTEPCW